MQRIVPNSAIWPAATRAAPAATAASGRTSRQLEAIDDCNKGNTAAGIPVLEKKLRSNGFTLPKR